MPADAAAPRFDPKRAARLRAWQELRDTPRAEAMWRYVRLVDAATPRQTV